MWIRTQNKHRVINSDQIIDIFIDRTGKLLIAEVPRATIDHGTSLITLGEYKDRDTCLKVLDDLFATHFPKVCTYRMPLGGEVE